MALLDRTYKQRMVGALVLVALAVIFLPMLFSRQDEQRQVRVDPPAAPQAPVMPQVHVEPVAVPEPQSLPEDSLPPEDEEEVAAPTAPAAKPATATPVAPAVAACADASPGRCTACGEARYHAKSCRSQRSAHQLVGAVGQPVEPRRRREPAEELA